jgi:hypothetical protein
MFYLLKTTKKNKDRELFLAKRERGSTNMSTLHTFLQKKEKDYGLYIFASLAVLFGILAVFFFLFAVGYYSRVLVEVYYFLS